MTKVFLAELKTLITAGNESVIEEWPTCKEKEENHIRNDVISRDHCIYSCVFGVDLIFRGNWAGTGNKAGLAEEVSAKSEVGNKAQVYCLIDEFM